MKVLDFEDSLKIVYLGSNPPLSVLQSVDGTLRLPRDFDDRWDAGEDISMDLEIRRNLSPVAVMDLHHGIQRGLDGVRESSAQGKTAVGAAPLLRLFPSSRHVFIDQSHYYWLGLGIWQGLLWLILFFLPNVVGTDRVFRHYLGFMGAASLPTLFAESAGFFLFFPWLDGSEKMFAAAVLALGTLAMLGYGIMLKHLLMKFQNGGVVVSLSIPIALLAIFYYWGPGLSQDMSLSSPLLWVFPVLPMIHVIEIGLFGPLGQILPSIFVLLLMVVLSLYLTFYWNNKEKVFFLESEKADASQPAESGKIVLP